MATEELIKLRQIWYNHSPALFEIVKTLKDKELSILDRINKIRNIRYLYASNILFLKKHFQHLNFYAHNTNLYHSCAYLKEVPVLTYNLKKRKEEPKYKEFNENYEQHIIGYDLFFDFDGKKDFILCHKEASEFKRLLETFKVPYYLLNSSSNGFHFIIPNNYFNQENILENIKLFKIVIDNIKLVWAFETLDETISDIKRLKKVPYSFVSDGTIALPLTDEQFLLFTPELVKCENVIETIEIKNRGLLLRTYDLTEEELKTKVLRFLLEFRE